jgi:hypothetical protein
MFNAAPKVKLVRVLEPYVIEFAAAVAAVVTTPVPDKASNVTSSTEVGADAPLAPPVVADQ